METRVLYGSMTIASIRPWRLRFLLALFAMFAMIAMLSALANSYNSLEQHHIVAVHDFIGTLGT